MHTCLAKCAVGARRKLGIKAAHLVVLALLASLALPGRAGDDRAVKSRVAAVYPEIAKRMRISGEVKIETTVDADGNVKDAKAISGNHTLGVAAEEAVRKWKFETGSGVAVVVVAVNFDLDH
jgi:TonB family protein